MRANCSTCYELLTCTDNLVCLPCGHVFHYHCTVQWFKSKKNCPQCRQRADERSARKIFLSEADEIDVSRSPEDLQQQIDNLQLQVRVGKCDLEKLKLDNEVIEERNKKIAEELRSADKARRDAENKTKEYKYQVKMFLEERTQYAAMQLEYETTKNKLAKYTLLEKTIEGSIGDVNMILHERGCFTNESRDLATLVVELKKKLSETRKLKAQLERKIDQNCSNREEDKKKIKHLSIQVSDLKMLKEKWDDEQKYLETCKEETEEENRSLKIKNRKLELKIERLNLELSKKENVSPVTFETSLLSESNEDSSLEKELTFMESPKVAYRSLAISAGIAGVATEKGEKRKASSQVSCSSQSSRIISQPLKKVKPNLLEIGTITFKDGKGYDGFGGISKPEYFPDPNNFIRRPANPKKPSQSKLKSSIQHSKVMKNQTTVDKFFGSFDTP